MLTKISATLEMLKREKVAVIGSPLGYPHSGVQFIKGYGNK